MPATYATCSEVSEQTCAAGQTHLRSADAQEIHEQLCKPGVSTVLLLRSQQPAHKLWEHTLQGTLRPRRPSNARNSNTPSYRFGGLILVTVRASCGGLSLANGSFADASEKFVPYKA